MEFSRLESVEVFVFSVLAALQPDGSDPHNIIFCPEIEVNLGRQL